MRSEKKDLSVLALFLSILITVSQISCAKSDPQGPQLGANQSNAQPVESGNAREPISSADVQSFRNMLTEVSIEVGQVGETKGASSDRRFVIFEEKHTSIASQFEIALMLLRLHDRYGLRDIVLEGLTDDKKFPDTQWFRNLGGPDETDTRDEVLVGMLRDGEISAVELLAMALPDVIIHSGDDAAAYQTKLTKQGAISSTIYLYKIGLKSVRSEHHARLNGLSQQHKISELVDYVISLDPWAKERHERMKDSKGSQSIEEILRELREIEQRAESVGAELSAEDRSAMAEAKAFFESADKRSHTTVRLTLGVAPQNPLVAVNIGAAHTEGVTRLLDDSAATYGVLTPLSHEKSAGDLSYESFDRKGELRSVTWTGKGLGSLLDGRKKPGPIVGQPWIKSFSEGRVATVLLLRAYRDKGGPDADIKRRIGSFGNFRVDWSSVDFKNGELTFKAAALIGEISKDIWVRAGTPRSADLARRSRLTLEQMLLRDLTAIRSESGERTQPPKSPTVEVITPDVLAAFAPQPEALKGVLSQSEAVSSCSRNVFFLRA